MKTFVPPCAGHFFAHNSFPQIAQMITQISADVHHLRNQRSDQRHLREILYENLYPAFVRDIFLLNGECYDFLFTIDY